VTSFRHRAEMFTDLEADPREGGPSLGDERATLVEFLRCQRLTRILASGNSVPVLAWKLVRRVTFRLPGKRFR
jgi:hypothetical protein